MAVILLYWFCCQVLPDGERVYFEIRAQAEEILEGTFLMLVFMEESCDIGGFSEFF